MTDMRVLVYFPGDLSRFSGTPIRAKNLVQALARLGVEITVLATSAPENQSANYDFVPLASSVHWFERFRFLKRIIREKRPDLLYSITHNALPVGVVSGLVCRVPHVIDLHSIQLEELKAESVLPLWRRYTLGGLERLLLPLCKGATVVCHPLKEHYQPLQRQIEVIPGGVNLHEFNPQVAPATEMQAVHRSDGLSLLVGYIGNFRPYQGVQELFKVALKIVKRDLTMRFVFIGDGPVKDELRDLVRRNDVDGRIYLLSEKPYADIPGYLSACDVLVIPRPANRITEYAFPSKLPEYLAMGKVVIATDVGDMKLYVKNGETGVLVPPDDPEKLEAAILAQKTNAHRREIGSRAFRSVQNEHSWDTRAETLLRFFRRLIQ